MAPLTLVEKYDDLARCANQPSSSYDKLNDKDYNDVIQKIWPFIIKSITYTPCIFKTNDTIMSTVSSEGKVKINLERHLKLYYHLYSKIAKEYQEIFPDRKPIKIKRDHCSTDNESSSIETTLAFSIDNTIETNIPNLQLLCSTGKFKKHLIKYVTETMQKSSHRELILKQAIKECCRCGRYVLLKDLCLIANISIDNIYFDNYDTVLHESIKLNNKRLTIELIQHRFDINIDGVLGTPLVTAIHYDILWAVQLLLDHGADLTKRHIDWPYLTLYEYCIEFSKVDIKLILQKYIQSLYRKSDHTTISKLIKNGWKISRDFKKHLTHFIH